MERIGRMAGAIFGSAEIARSLAIVKIVFLNRYFYPDHSATSQLLTDLAFHLAAQGHEVCVITSRQRYDAAASSLPASELIQGVSVLRLSTTRFGRGNLLGRSFDYLSFYCAAFVRLLRVLRRGDVVVAKTDPPLISVVTALAAWLKDARLVNWLQDVFPEVAVALGMALAKGMLGRALRFGRDVSLRVASVNVVIGAGMVAKLSHAVPTKQLRVIPNWVDDSTIVPLPAVRNLLRVEWGLTGKFVVGYSGNMGRAHSLAPILRAAELLRKDTELVFLLIGDGAGRAPLETEVQNKGLANVRFKPYQPRETLGLSLTLPDVHLVSLKPALEGLIVPSKAYGVLAAGRPMLFMGAADGELGRLVVNGECGEVVPAEDGDALAAAIRRLKDDPARCATMGVRARATLDDGYSKAAALAAWEEVLMAAGSRSKK